MKFSFASKSTIGSLFSMFASFVSQAIKPLAKKFTRWAAKNSTPAAREYATNFASDLAEDIPAVVADLAGTAVSIASKGLSPAAGLEAASVATDALTNKASSLRYLFKLPFKAYKAYKGYRYLNHKETGPEMTSREEDGFTILEHQRYSL